MTETRIVTMGCRLNAFESEVMRAEAAAAGVTGTVIVNTCAVTGEAVRQARQTIRRLRRERPDDRIVVTGCAAQLQPAAFAAMPEVDQVLGNAEKLDRRHLADRDSVVAVADIAAEPSRTPPVLEGFDGRARAFVQIQQGCDHHCTFCIIPAARGPNRSVPAEQIIEQVRTLAVRGTSEVVLTGVDICSYGTDLAERPRLGDLVRAVLGGVAELPRLRLSTVDPAAVDDALVAAFGEEDRLMPHVHFSLQAMDDTVLKRMRRRHLCADVFALAKSLRNARPGIVFGADLIAGFPTETAEMAETTLDAVEALDLPYLHVFPYSPRHGTPAARMPQVPGPERRARAARLREAGARARRRFHVRRVGARVEVLVETARTGRCRHYATVRLDRDAVPGEAIPVRIDGCDHDGLTASLIP